MSQLLIRSTAITTPEVDGRTIVGLCVPYNKPTIVTDDGVNYYQEQFVPGAFNRAISVPHRVNIRLSHSSDRIVRAGRGAAFREETEGLVGEFVADETPVGDALLARARTGEPVPLSIGQIPLHSEKRSGVVTRTSVHLDHVAATEDRPQYADARILAVRAQELDDTRTLAYWLAKYGDLLHSA